MATNLIENPKLRAQIERLQQQSAAQWPDITGYFTARARAGDLDWRGLDEDAHRFFADKLVALDPDKAEFCHLLCRSVGTTGATNIVEVGTSFGVSTLYLAEAVRLNGGGKVVATEYEPEKAVAAARNFVEAGLEHLIELREGDLRETLVSLEGPIDFVLMDIWTEMVVPAMELITPHLRRGAAIVCDNTVDFAEAYRDYFGFIERNGFVTRTLPFDGGLELTVKT